MFHNNLPCKNIVGEGGAPPLLQKEKRRPAKFDVSKMLFPDIGKITNLYEWKIQHHAMLKGSLYGLILLFCS